MKYAYLFGSSVFVVPGKVISYTGQGEKKDFLRINSIYHDQAPTSPKTFLECDLDIKAIDGTPVTILANKPARAMPYNIKTERDSIHVLRADGETVIHIQQLDDESAMNLEHNIVAELEVNMPVVVIRIFGEFMLGNLYINAENEKLFINDNGYATSALAGANQLMFTADGVVL